MSFGLTYSNLPRGAAYLSSDAYPDLFVLVSRGLREALGFWRCAYDATAEDGSLIYRAPSG